MSRGAIILVIVLAACEAKLGGSSDDGEDTEADASTDAGAPAVSRDAGPDAAPNLTPSQRCQARYGAVPAFEICATTGMSCSFIATNGDVSCETHCAAYGGVCIGAEDNEIGLCTLENDPAATCQTTGKTDLLCTCTLP